MNSDSYEGDIQLLIARERGLMGAIAGELLWMSAPAGPEPAAKAVHLIEQLEQRLRWTQRALTLIRALRSDYERQKLGHA